MIGRALPAFWASLSTNHSSLSLCFVPCSVVFSRTLFPWSLQWLFTFPFVPISVCFSLCLFMPGPCSELAVLIPFSRYALPCPGPAFPSCHFFCPPSPHHFLAPLAALVTPCRPLHRLLCLLRLGHNPPSLSHPHLGLGLLWAQHHRLSRALALLPLPCFDFFSLTSVASRLSNGSPSTGTLALLTSTS